MHTVDYLLIGILLAVVCLASYAIYRSKKKGKKCIGCPDSGCCGGSCAGCSANCAHRCEN